MDFSERKIRIADAYPELVADLDDEQAQLARRHAVATTYTLGPGLWHPSRRPQAPESGHLGVLVLEGLLTRDVALGDTRATELVGRGDLLRPADDDGESAPIPFAVDWHVLEQTRVAILDRQFARVIGHWPEAMAVIVRGAVGRAQSLAVTLATSHMRGIENRVLVLMWYLADRWGRVRPDGVHVPLRLTHETLGRLVGAQRPSVTTALSRLAGDGMLTRTTDRTWVLHGEPPDSYAGLKRTAEQVSSIAT